MAFISAHSISKQISQRGGANPVTFANDGVAFSLCTGGTNKAGTKNRSQFRFSIGGVIAQKARLIDGDRVDFLFDHESRMGLIKRVNDGSGWKVTSTPGGKTKTPTLYCKGTIYEGFPMPIKGGSLMINTVVSDEGIMFDFPKEVIIPGASNEKQKD